MPPPPSHHSPQKRRQMRSNSSNKSSSSTGSSTGGSSSNRRRQRCGSSVSFDEVEIYGFTRVLGDNPCALGAPLRLDTRPHYQLIVPIDDYERFRQHQQPRRRGEDLRLSSLERETYLLNTGYCRNDVVVATHNSAQTRHERWQSYQYGRYGGEWVSLLWEYLCQYQAILLPTPRLYDQLFVWKQQHPPKQQPTFRIQWFCLLLVIGYWVAKTLFLYNGDHAEIQSDILLPLLE